MIAHIEFFFQVFIKLFVILTPFAAVPVFLGVTPQMTPAQRKKTARTACTVAAAILIFFAISGPFLFEALGVSRPAFNLAGGLLLLLLGLDLLFSKDSENNDTANVDWSDVGNSVAISPIAIPLLTGPGSITTVIALEFDYTTLVDQLIIASTIPFLFLTIYWLLTASARGADWLTPSLIRIIKRINGLLLSAIAMEIILNGLIYAGILDRENFTAFVG